jgi:hypothetical protein
VSATQFTPGKVEIATKDGPRRIDAKRSGDLAIHPAIGGSGWAVSHLPTGARIYLADTENEAVDIAALVEREHKDFLRATRRMQFATRPGAARRLRGKNKEAADRLRAALAKARGDQ